MIMQISNDWSTYWDISEKQQYGGIIFFSNTDDPVCLDNMPNGRKYAKDKNGLSLSGGSLCITTDSVYRWIPSTEEWKEM